MKKNKKRLGEKNRRKEIVQIECYRKMETSCYSKEEKLKLGKIIDNRNMQHMNSTDDDNFAVSLWI